LTRTLSSNSPDIIHLHIWVHDGDECHALVEKFLFYFIVIFI